MLITIEQARALYSDEDPVHDFAHVLRVLALAERLGQAEGADVAVLRQAALLHDISRPLDPNDANAFALEVDPETDHAVLAGRAARLTLAGQPPEFIEAVVHCIEAHRFRNSIEPRSIEAMCLFDADKLDAIGAIGVARAFAYAGLRGMPLWGEVSADYVAGQSAELHTPHHEFIVKLQKIKDRLYTRTGRQMAEERHSVMAAFFEQLRAEVEGRR